MLTRTAICSSLGLALLCGCEGADAWTPFGNPAELEVEVGGTDLLPPQETFAGGQVAEDLSVASVTLDPGGGPVGTEHSLRVAVEEAFEAEVQRVTVRVDAGEYGSDLFELEQDPAFMGEWGITLESLGEASDGPRTDTLTVRLWVPTEDDNS